MIVLRGNQIIFCDVDDTLVKWGTPTTEEEMKDAIPITCPISKTYIDNEPIEVESWIEYLRPHKKHIEQIKLHKMRGHTVVIWSAGGAEWAEAVVKALNLENYVDLVIGKPTWTYDDLKFHEFMGKVIYLKDE